MTTFPIMALAILMGLFNYGVWGKHLEKNIAKADDSRPTPAFTKRDDKDYAPQNKFVLLGSHWPTIAGAGPITGPAFAALWGWLPGVIYLLIGSAILGTVHDYLAIMGSVRFGGLTLGEYTRRMLGGRARNIIQTFGFVYMIGASAAFINNTAGSFVGVKEAVLPAIVSVPVAMTLGYLLYKKNAKPLVPTLVSIAIVLACIYYGFQYPIHLSLNAWRVVLVVYTLAASWLPVWLLLVPRGYINLYVLSAGLILGVVSLLKGNLPLALPPVHGFSSMMGLPLWPMMFVFLGCGAISGGHSLLGTSTAKQIEKESDVRFIVIGAFALELIIAIVAMLCIAAGTDPQFLLETMKGPGPAPVFAKGYGTVLNAAFPVISQKVGAVLAMIWFNGFVLTTAEALPRNARYILQEVAPESWKWAKTREGSAILSTVIIAYLTFSSTVLDALGNWLLADHLLGGVVLMILSTLILAWRSNPYLAFIPGCALWFTTACGGALQIQGYLKAGKYPIAVFSIVYILLSLLVFFEVIKGLREQDKVMERVTAATGA